MMKLQHIMLTTTRSSLHMQLEADGFVDKYHGIQKYLSQQYSKT